MTEKIRSTSDGVVELRRRPDGRYAVLVAGEVIFETGVLSAANIYYDEETDRHRSQSPQRDRLARERAHYDMQAVRSDSFARRTAHAQKQGGKGGRGGV